MGEEHPQRVVEQQMQFEWTDGSEESEFSSWLGKRVRLHGLKARPELNGRYGSVFSWHADTGRCGVSIDGEEGILRYRGIPIEEVAAHSHFIETAYLLIWGSLSTQEELSTFSNLLTKHQMLHENIRHHLDLFPSASPPMAVLSAALNTLSCFHPEFLQIEDAATFHEAVARIMAKVRTIAAYPYRHAQGLPII